MGLWKQVYLIGSLQGRKSHQWHHPGDTLENYRRRPKWWWIEHLISSDEEKSSKGMTIKLKKKLW